MHRCTAISALILAAGTASAQSFNVDINATSGNGAGVPANSFVGAANQSGVWNNINPSTAASTTLVNLNGAATSVSFAWNKTTPITGVFDSGITGETAKLMQDGQMMDNWGTLTYTFGNLQAGTYAVFTYAGRPASDIEAGVTVTGTTSSYQYVGANLTNDLMPGDSHAIHIITVTAGGQIQVKVNDTIGGLATCTGIQLRKIDSERLRFYVAKSQTSNPNTGTSWSSAYEDLNPLLKQLALVGGDACEVWTKSSFYYPTTGSSRTESFVIPSGLHLYGGFAGSETSLSQRTAPWFFITAMSGAIGGSGSSDNSYHVVDASDVSSSTLIDGFTIANGRASGGGDDSKGGGMLAVASRVQIHNCKFISNYASVSGGAVYSTDYPAFHNTQFISNDSDGAGGAIYHHTTGYPTIYRSVFLGNSATGDAGGVKALFAGVRVFNSLFSGNTASSGNGGALNIAGDGTDDAIITNCTFSKNFSGVTAGGLYANNQASIELRNSILWGNTDPNSSNVVAKQYATNSSATITKFNTTVEGLNSNPNFVDADGSDNLPGTTDDNCRLQDNSPCIDTGDNAYLPWDFADIDGDGFTFEYYPFDLDGEDRVLDVPWASGETSATVDRGAYEFQYHTCPADFDKSGFVDLDDYVAFVAAFEAGTQNADFDKTGFVDTDDFTAFVLAFEAGC
ncbi:MAG TPA: GC-type dockerin domain-anchored protein [Phycisphaerales bacterium]|nr:GC-type dockerin domain-anchored protein [Phycisphaerales bacterium]